MPEVFSDCKSNSGREVELLNATAGIVHGGSLKMWTATLPITSEIMM